MDERIRWLFNWAVQNVRQRFIAEFFLETQEHNFPEIPGRLEAEARREKDLFFFRNLRSETRIPIDLAAQSLRCAGF